MLAHRCRRNNQIGGRGNTILQSQYNNGFTQESSVDTNIIQRESSWETEYSNGFKLSPCKLLSCKGEKIILRMGDRQKLLLLKEVPWSNSMRKGEAMRKKGWAILFNTQDYNIDFYHCNNTEIGMWDVNIFQKRLNSVCWWYDYEPRNSRESNEKLF